MTNLKNIDFDSFIEKDLYRIVRNAADLNDTMKTSKILEVKKFKKWCKKNYYKIDLWINNIINVTQQELCEKKLIIETNEKENEESEKTKQQVVTNKLIEEAIKLKGLRKFLLDFSTMSEKEYIDVHLWEDYLVFAEMFGIAKKVEKQFSEIYPYFNKQAILNTNITLDVASGMSNIWYKGMNIGIRKYNTGKMFSTFFEEGDSSGGGGSSFSSGGGSAGGSSGGGFR